MLASHSYDSGYSRSTPSRQAECGDWAVSFDPKPKAQALPGSSVPAGTCRRLRLRVKRVWGLGVADESDGQEK